MEKVELGKNGDWVKLQISVEHCRIVHLCN